MKHYITNWWQSLQMQMEGLPSWFIDAALYALLGLLVGFLAKNLGKFFLYATIGIILGLAALQYAQLITVHTALIKHILGVSHINSVTEALELSVTYVRVHIIACIAAAIGFFAGWRLS